ncbi:711_t:CDS:1, partial [Gigaspora margarita]
MSNKKAKQIINTNTFKSRIKSQIPLEYPSTIPAINKSNSYNSDEWRGLHQKLQEKKKQHKIDMNYAEVFTRLSQFETLYYHIQSQTFISDLERNKTISKLIKESIPDGMVTEISRWRKVYDFVVMIIEKKAIDFDTFLLEIRGLDISINYLQEVDKGDFELLVDLIVETYKKK